jgi:hypothetical protein
MYCPGCGKDVMNELNFCNNCGTNMAAVKQAMSAGPAYPQAAPPAPAVQLPEEIFDYNKKRRKFKSIGLGLMLLGLLWAITFSIVGDMVGEFSRTAGHILDHIAEFCSLFFIAGPVVMILGKTMYKHKDAPQVIVVQQPQAQMPTQNVGQPLFQAPPQQQQYQQPNALPMENQSYNFESYQYPPPSVTEHTTNRLRQPAPVPRKQ